MSLGSNSEALLLILILAAVSQLHGCPTGATQVSVGESGGGTPWCVTDLKSTPVTFCEAVKACHAMGAEMISKPVLDAIKASGTVSNSGNWWVGLIDALNERGSNKSGWVWMKDGQVTTGTDGYFKMDEPNNSHFQDCTNVFTTDFQLRDASCNENHMFLCYIDPSVRTVNPAEFRFDRAEIVDFNQPDPGCSIRYSGIPSVFDCTVNCYSFGPDCVGFYWHPGRRECIILPYFDATVQLAFSSPDDQRLWLKFVKYSIPGK